VAQTDLPEIAQVRIARDIGGERARYEDLEVGRDLGTARMFFTQREIDVNCSRRDVYHPWYSVNSPFGGTIVPIGMTSVVGRQLLSSAYNIVGMFHNWAFKSLHPLRAGVEYQYSARLSDKWIKNDREFVAYEGVCKDMSGQLMFTNRRAHVLDYIKRTAPKVGEGGIESRPTVFDHGGLARDGVVPDRGAPNAVTNYVIDVSPLATLETRLGTPLPSLSHVYTDEYLDRAAGVNEGGFRSNDHEAARREGLPKSFSGGPPVMGLIHHAALQFFGVGWVEGGTADLTMLHPVFADDFATAKALVTGKELLHDGSARLTCDAWVESQTGEKKIAGTVSGIVR